MALADFTPERAKIVYRGKVLAEVRGLCLEDVSVLIRSHLDDIQRLYALVQDGGNADVLSRMATDGFLLKLVTDAPTLAGTILALASDEPGSEDAARRLPLPVQLRVLGEVMRLTFEDVGGPKAFVALVMQMVRKQLPAEAEPLATKP